MEFVGEEGDILCVSVSERAGPLHCDLHVSLNR